MYVIFRLVVFVPTLVSVNLPTWKATPTEMPQILRKKRSAWKRW